jgi:hypothetical protein
MLQVACYVCLNIPNVGCALVLVLGCTNGFSIREELACGSMGGVVVKDFNGSFLL